MPVFRILDWEWEREPRYSFSSGSSKNYPLPRRDSDGEREREKSKRVRKKKDRRVERLWNDERREKRSLVRQPDPTYLTRSLETEYILLEREKRERGERDWRRREMEIGVFSLIRLSFSRPIDVYRKSCIKIVLNYFW